MHAKIQRKREHTLTLMNTPNLTKYTVIQQVKNSGLYINHSLHSRALRAGSQTLYLASLTHFTPSQTDYLRSIRPKIFFSQVWPRFLKRPPSRWCYKYKVSFNVAYFLQNPTRKKTKKPKFECICPKI